MSTQEVRRPTLIKGYARRKKPFDVDLNVPPGEALEETAVQTSQQTHNVVQDCEGSGSGGGGSGSQMPAAIDLEAIDDEVVISSPSQFAEARKKSRRNNNQERFFPGSVEEITLTLNSYTRRRIPPNRTVIDCEQYINLESGCNTMIEKSQDQVKDMAPPPPPKEPTFSCPICMGPLVEEASTKCGHIFCMKCIKAAIAAQSKCPSCRKKLTKKDVIRVYLPATHVNNQ